jgi:hypothetical protein
LKEVNVNGDKGGGGIALLNLVGMKSGCEEENNQLVSESLPPLDVDLYNRADAVFCTPLSFFFFFFVSGKPIA